MITESTVPTTQATPSANWWRSLTTLPSRMLAALADSTRDWRRGCGL